MGLEVLRCHADIMYEIKKLGIIWLDVYLNFYQVLSLDN